MYDLDVNRFSVGFDNMRKLFDNFVKEVKLPTFPPYNIKKTDENTVVLEFAVAGFGKNEIEINVANNVLTITGRIENKTPENYLFKGISNKSFEQKFILSDTIEVKGAEMINGMLKVVLENLVPEKKNSKKIDIK